ncbi:MAG: IS21 family transposase [Bacteroidales bacterium]|jgi:transposase|nr:IS21 family transposase [Bacteroidales bacterium]
MKDEAFENSVIFQRGQGWSVRRLAREYHCGRKRIIRVLAENERQRMEGTNPPKPRKVYPSKLDPYKEHIQETLQKFKDITTQRIYEQVLERGYTGKISILEVYVSKIRSTKSHPVVRCVETAPGQRAAHDWSEYMIEFTSSEGKEHKIILFSYILAYSRRQYIELVEDKAQRTLMECLAHAFMYFDGVAREIKSDNQKVCVDRWECGQPIFNRHYLGFASHYGFRPMTIHPGRPTENLKIERPFYYLETNFLNGRRFRDKNDLKEQLRNWLAQVNDTREHRTTRRRPIDMFLEEIPCLVPLPTTHYDTSLIVYRVVNQESCVHYLGYYYYIPGDYLFKSCPLRITSDQVIIYSHDFKLLISHPLAEKGATGRYIGLLPTYAHPLILKLSEVKQRLSSMGRVMEAYVEKLVRQKKDPTQALNALLALKVHYFTEDILKAIGRAMDHGAYDVKTIERFLKAHAQGRDAIKTLFDQLPDDEG